jgi:hypothetical protein
MLPRTLPRPWTTLDLDRDIPFGMFSFETDRRICICDPRFESDRSTSEPRLTTSVPTAGELSDTRILQEESRTITA